MLSKSFDKITTHFTGKHIILLLLLLQKKLINFSIKRYLASERISPMLADKSEAGKTLFPFGISLSTTSRPVATLKWSNSICEAISAWCSAELRFLASACSPATAIIFANLPWGVASIFHGVYQFVHGVLLLCSRVPACLRLPLYITK